MHSRAAPASLGLVRAGLGGQGGAGCAPGPDLLPDAGQPPQTSRALLMEPFWQGNEVILNKGYFQHKMFNRSNASGLLQVSEETEWKATLMKHG